MENLNTFFEKKGTIFLDYLNYVVLTLEYNPIDTHIEIEDRLEYEFVEEGRKLRVLFTRYVHHSPEKLYQLTVRFGTLLSFTKEALMNSSIYEKDYNTFFADNNNGLVKNIIARTSLLISQITSSHGNEPLVTPPYFIQK